MNFPKDLKYTADHEWVRCDGERCYIGITDHAQNELGEIVYVDVDCMDEEFGQGEVFGSIEAVKTVADMIMPVAGKVVEINEELADAPELVNSDPYGKGWIIAIEGADEDQFKALMSADAYTEMIGK